MHLSISASLYFTTFLVLLRRMYCLNGTSGSDDPSTNEAVNPLYQLSFTDWWMHHVNGCDQFPPAPGDFLELPANGEFTVELAMNRAFTSFSFHGQFMGTFADGQDHPGLGDTPPGVQPSCITEPNSTLVLLPRRFVIDGCARSPHSE
ncbi:hypothetical protein H0H87_006215 [Tephrocybe sp. NHM501043]|nr:hypothetical protein H0H87_006215 [Tephrocybe sp. NHM501043]